MAERIKITFVLFFLLLHSAPVHCFVSVRVCGQKLVGMVTQLCKLNDHRNLPVDNAEQAEQLNTRVKESLMESCCWKRCTYSHFKSYCNLIRSAAAAADSSSSSGESGQPLEDDVVGLFSTWNNTHSTQKRSVLYDQNVPSGFSHLRHLRRHRFNNP